PGRSGRAPPRTRPTSSPPGGDASRARARSGRAAPAAPPPAACPAAGGPALGRSRRNRGTAGTYARTAHTPSRALRALRSGSQPATSRQAAEAGPAATGALRRWPPGPAEAVGVDAQVSERLHVVTAEVPPDPCEDPVADDVELLGGGRPLACETEGEREHLLVAAEPLAAQVLQHLFVGDAVKRVALDHLVEPALRLDAVDLAPARAPWTSNGSVACGSAATHCPIHCR